VLRKMRGPLFSLAAGLLAFALGTGLLLTICLAVLVGVLAWMWGLRSDVADLRAEGYGNYPLGGWIAGGDMGGGGGG